MNQVVKSAYICQNSDWNVIGESLGHEWNFICDLMQKERLYGDDGSGSFTLISVDTVRHPILKEIAKELLSQSNQFPIYVINDF